MVNIGNAYNLIPAHTCTICMYCLLGVRKFKIDSQASSVNAEPVAAQAPDFTSTKDTGNSIGGSSSSCSSRDEDAHCGLSSEKALHYSIILAEINRKYSSINFRPK